MKNKCFFIAIIAIFMSVNLCAQESSQQIRIKTRFILSPQVFEGSVLLSSHSEINDIIGRNTTVAEHFRKGSSLLNIGQTLVLCFPAAVLGGFLGAPDDPEIALLVGGSIGGLCLLVGVPLWISGKKQLKKAEKKYNSSLTSYKESSPTLNYSLVPMTNGKNSIGGLGVKLCLTF